MMNNPYVEIRNISKSFGVVKALQNINISLYKGTVTGLLGINGAGKSTLMNVLGGVHTPDTGEIVIGGKKCDIKTPIDSEKAGIAFIHQEAAYFQYLTVAENMFINDFSAVKDKGKINYKKMRENAQKYLDVIGCKASPKEEMTNVSIGDRQMIEIASVLSKGAGIFLFDEPTSSLSQTEKRNLFSIIKQLKEQGNVIVYITHFLDEAVEICDNIVVMRDGKIGDTIQKNEFDMQRIINAIVGREMYEDDSAQDYSDTRGDKILAVENISDGSKVYDASFDLYRGEVLGIWGLMGSGRTELVRTVLGYTKPREGRAYYIDNDEKTLLSKKTVREKIGYVTESRHTDGLFLDAPLWFNMTLPSLQKLKKENGTFVNVKKECELGSEQIDRLGIACTGPKARAEMLSGGNQQKVLFARWMIKNPEIFVFDEPTRGVDVGAKNDIHNEIKKLSKDGKAVVVISSEIEEIMKVSTRIIVINHGKIVGSIDKKDFKKDLLMKYCAQ